MEPTDQQLSSHQFLTAPNLFTLARLCCIPLFLWMLFTRDNVAGAAFLLGGLGATDWVDGWLHFERSHGAAGVEHTYQQLLAGRVDPRVGHVCTMEDE